MERKRSLTLLLSTTLLLVMVMRTNCVTVESSNDGTVLPDSMYDPPPLHMRPKKDIDYVDAVSMLRSHSRNLFDSDQAMAAAFRREESRLFDTSPSNSAVHNQRRSFIVRHREGCHDKCHMPLFSHLGRERYSILGKNHGLLYASPAELIDLSATEPHVSTMVYQIPLLPDNKVEHEVRRLHTEAASAELCREELRKASPYFLNHRHPVSPDAEKNRKLPPLQLRLVLPPMESDGHVQQFLEFAKHAKEELKQQLNGLEVDFQYQPDSRRKRSRAKPTQREHYALLTLPQDRCADLQKVVAMFAARPEVQWIERAYNAFPHNRWVKGLTDTGQHDNTPLFNGAFTGTDEIVGVTDTGIDMKNCFFEDTSNNINYVSLAAASTTTADTSQRKVVQYIPYADTIEDTDGHGTHVAGIVAGLTVENYGDYKRYSGTTPDAKISFFDIGNEESEANSNLVFPQDIDNDIFVPLYESGAFIMTNSWGTTNNNYDTLASRVDEFMNDNPDALVLFSAGNSGDLGGSTVGSPATCKNCVAVGAALNDNQAWRAYEGDDDSSIYGKNAVASFSSQGPTSDGRLVPHVLAPGWWVTSAEGKFNSSKSFCDIDVLKGTSMSCPVAAANAIRVRQYFVNGYYPSGAATFTDEFTPSGALLKAMLVHSSKPMEYIVDNDDTSSVSDIDSNDYPSTVQGYGRVQLDQVLNFAESSSTPISLFVRGGARDGDDTYSDVTSTALTRIFLFQTSSSTNQAPIRITFAYTDPPGSTASSTDRMINELSIQVTGGGDTFTPLTASGVSVTGNLQMIEIENPDASTAYTVTVTADTLLSSPQPFALVVTGSTTYLSDSINDDDNPEEGDSDSLSVDGDALPYVIFLGVLVVVLIVLVCWFRRISKQANSVILDPHNFESELYDEANSKKVGIISRITNMRANQKARAAQRRAIQQAQRELDNQGDYYYD